MKKNNNSKNVTSGFFWTFGERISAQLVSTLVTIVLARVLEPTHYGIIAIVTVFIGICNVFVTGGMGSAIVQKKEVDDCDYNSAFMISIMMSIILYIILFFTSPYVARFYKMQELSSVIRVMALRLPIASVNTIQQAHVQRQMAFKKFFVATLFGTVISGIVGVCMAISGFGVWALVAQYLTNTTIDTIVLFFTDGWKPKFQFSLRKAKDIFSFGWKVLAAELVYTLEADIRSLIIGKVFGSADLAYFDQGKKYPSLIVTNINTAINKVMLPAYSQEQDNLVRLKQMLRRSISIGIFVLAPLMVGFAAVSNNFVLVILTDKWISSVPFIQIFCLSYLTRPLETSCHQALLAVGRSDIVLYIIIILNVFSLGTVVIAVFVFKSVFYIVIGYLICTLLSILCFMICTSKIIGYTPQEQLADIIPPLSISLVMGVAVMVVDKISIRPILSLFLQILIGALIYFVLALVFKIEALSYLHGFIKRKGKKWGD